MPTENDLLQSADIYSIVKTTGQQQGKKLDKIHAELRRLNGGTGKQSVNEPAVKMVKSVNKAMVANNAAMVAKVDAIATITKSSTEKAERRAIRQQKATAKASKAVLSNEPVQTAAELKDAAKITAEPVTKELAKVEKAIEKSTPTKSEKAAPRRGKNGQFLKDGETEEPEAPKGWLAKLVYSIRDLGQQKDLADTAGSAAGGVFWHIAKEIGEVGAQLAETSIGQRLINSKAGQYIADKKNALAEKVSAASERVLSKTPLAKAEEQKPASSDDQEQEKQNDVVVAALKEEKQERKEAKKHRKKTERALDNIAASSKRAAASGGAGGGLGLGLDVGLDDFDRKNNRQRTPRKGGRFARLARGLGSIGGKALGLFGLGAVASSATGSASLLSNSANIASDAAKPVASTVNSASKAVGAAEAGGSRLASPMAKKAVAKGLGRVALRAIPIIGTLAMTAYDAYEGATNKDLHKKAFGLKDGEEATFGQKAASAAGNVLDLGGLVSGTARFFGADVETSDIVAGVSKYFGGDYADKDGNKVEGEGFLRSDALKNMIPVYGAFSAIKNYFEDEPESPEFKDDYRKDGSAAKSKEFLLNTSQKAIEQNSFVKAGNFALDQLNNTEQGQQFKASAQDFLSKVTAQAKVINAEMIKESQRDLVQEQKQYEFEKLATEAVGLPAPAPPPETKYPKELTQELKRIGQLLEKANQQRDDKQVPTRFSSSELDRLAADIL